MAIQAKRKLMPQFQGLLFWKLSIYQKISTKDKKTTKNATQKNALIGSRNNLFMSRYLQKHPGNICGKNPAGVMSYLQ